MVKAFTPETASILSGAAGYITKLARVKELDVKVDMPRPKMSAVTVTADAEVYIPLEGVVDLEAELQRLTKEIAKTEKELKPFEAKMANEGFVAKAPPEVLEKTRGIIAELTSKKEKLAESMKRLEGLKEQ